jgi:hypothetical protein
VAVAVSSGPGRAPIVGADVENMSMNEILPPAQVWPCLRARDARGLIRFLVEAFGFEEVAAAAGFLRCLRGDRRS